jgi:hypothetical protein
MKTSGRSPLIAAPAPAARTGPWSRAAPPAGRRRGRRRAARFAALSSPHRQMGAHDLGDQKACRNSLRISSGAPPPWCPAPRRRPAAAARWRRRWPDARRPWPRHPAVGRQAADAARRSRSVGVRIVAQLARLEPHAAAGRRGRSAGARTAHRVVGHRAALRCWPAPAALRRVLHQPPGGQRQQRHQQQRQVGRQRVAQAQVPGLARPAAAAGAGPPIGTSGRSGRCSSTAMPGPQRASSVAAVVWASSAA